MKIKILKTKSDKIIGLSNRNKIDKNEAALLLDTNIITMKDTKFPLTLVFLDKNNKIISIKDGTPFSNKLYKEEEATSVLEINPDIKDKFKIGKIINFEKLRKNKYERGGVLDDSMILLDHEGNPQMELYTKELVVSRKETEQLIKLAKKTNTEKELYELGRLMYEIRMKQRQRQRK